MELEKLISAEQLKKLQELGVLNEIRLRNLKIREEFSFLRKNLPYKTTIKILAKKYFLSEERVEHIVCQKGGA